MRSELETALTLAKTLPVEDLPEFLGSLETVRIVAFARIAAPAVEARPDELLEVPEAAHRLGVSPDYLYRHSRRFPFTRRMGRKLLFSSAGLDAYLRKSR
jgi:excisionase family DNA binding protein